eukprot:3221923-Lingulodinium_polyedra.AAC.1
MICATHRHLQSPGHAIRLANAVWAPEPDAAPAATPDPPAAPAAAAAAAPAPAGDGLATDAGLTENAQPGPAGASPRQPADAPATTADADGDVSEPSTPTSGAPNAELRNRHGAKHQTAR